MEWILLACAIMIASVLYPTWPEIKARITAFRQGKDFKE